MLGFGVISWIGREDAARTGDAFGAANALFSGLALAGVILALRMQSLEIRLQHKELIQSNKEMSRQADAQVSSQRTLAEQVARMIESSRIQALSVIIQSIDAELNTTHINPIRKNELLGERAGAINEIRQLRASLANKTGAGNV